MNSAIESAAARLVSAAQSRTPCAPVRDLIGPTDLDAAYLVQDTITNRRLTNGERLIGRKIGLTSRAVQTQLRVDQPDFGTLFSDMAFADREPIPLTRLMQPRVEAEVAFVLGKGIATESPNVADILRATEYVLPAIEVVDSRIASWDIAITDTIADNGSSGVFVLGTTPRRPDRVDLPELGMVIETRGTVVSSGAGAACLGSPVTAVVWLARTLSRRGEPLCAGDVVLSGALGPVVDVTGPDVFTARLSGLGQVSALFDEAEAA